MGRLLAFDLAQCREFAFCWLHELTVMGQHSEIMNMPSEPENRPIASGKTAFDSYARWALMISLVVAVASISVRIGSGDRDAVISAGNDGDTTALAELETAARLNSGDVEAWRALGQGQFGSRHFAEAANSFRRATQLRPDDATLWSSLGEALVLADERSPLPDEALAAFRQANRLDRADPRARYFLAAHRDLTGDHEGAIADWLALLKDTPKGAAWEADLKQTIEQVGKVNGIETASRLAAIKQPDAAGDPSLSTIPPSSPGPSRDEVEAAASLSPAQQRMMAETMVSRLEERLREEPKRVDGWMLLIRSRMSLGQPDRAKRALDDAITANPEATSELREQAASLGVR